MEKFIYQTHLSLSSGFVGRIDMEGNSVKIGVGRSPVNGSSEAAVGSIEGCELISLLGEEESGP